MNQSKVIGLGDLINKNDVVNYVDIEIVKILFIDISGLLLFDGSKVMVGDLKMGDKKIIGLVYFVEDDLS